MEGITKIKISFAVLMALNTEINNAALDWTTWVRDIYERSLSTLGTSRVSATPNPTHTSARFIRI